MITILFIIPLITLLFIFYLNTVKYTLVYSSSISSYYVKLFTTAMQTIYKWLTLLSLFTTLFYSLYLWKSFPKFYSDIVLFPTAIQLGEINLFEVSTNLNLPFIILSSFILIVSILTAWYSGVDMLLFCTMMLLLEICLIGAFSCTNLFVFLLFFEASALPIFILIVYCGSARKERLKAGYYFLFYTFYGSLSLLLLLLNLYSLNQIDFMNSNDILPINNKILWLLLFIAFAVKIPLFPFHVWLPYAHVEASTSTSIILAALMLKLGGYGIVKFMLPLFNVSVHRYYQFIVISICVIGCIYASFNALRQIDLKRYVAFSSIAHMSFATLGIFTYSEIGIKGSIYLMLSHGLTSAALFFLVGVLSDRYHTRAITAFSGLLLTMPVFSFFFILMSLANVGFPGTSGFIPELEILISILSQSITDNPSLYYILFILFGMFLTTVSTLVPMLRMLFGYSKLFAFKSNWIDLSKLEFFILLILSIFVLFLGLYDLLYWI